MAHNMLPLSELFKAPELCLSQGWEPPHLHIVQSTIITLNKPPFIMETPTNPSFQPTVTPSSTNPDASALSVDNELAKSILQKLGEVLDEHYDKLYDLPSMLVAVANLLAAATGRFKDNFKDAQVNGMHIPLDFEYITLGCLQAAGLENDLDFGKYLKLDELRDHKGMVIRSYKSEWHDKINCIFLAFCNSYLVGCIEMTIYTKGKDMGMAYLWNLHVDDGYRQNGFGRELIDYAMKIARKADCTRAALDWDSKSSPRWVRDWYIRLGFVETAYDKACTFLEKKLK